MNYVSMFLLLLTVCSCEWTGVNCDVTTDQTSGLVVRELPHYVAQDRDGDLGRFGFHITTPETYSRVFASCCASRLEPVDFTRYDVIGLSTVNRGSNSSYLLDVKRDDTQKTITYIVTERYCRRSSPVDGRGNFVVIPKVPAGYRLIYERN